LTEASKVALDQELSPVAEQRLPGMRLWFVVYLGWLVALTVVALQLFAQYEAGNASALGFWILALMCFYLSLCNAFLPLPTAWIILYAASADAGLFESGLLRIVVVAICGALATVSANLNEYHGLAYLFRHGLGHRVRSTTVYQWAIRWFNKAPFQTLSVIGFIPIPIDAVRWLAILRHYSRVRFALAYFLGRGLRYLLFAWFSVVSNMGAWEILGIQVGILVAALVGRLIWPLVVRGPAAADEANPLAAEQ
jgi:membrane protein YqaA with SNARE-associated domain